VCKAFEKVESPPVAVRVVPTVKVEPTARAPVVVELVEVEFPPIVSPPTIVVEAFWKMFVPDQRLLVVVPKAREIIGVAPPVDWIG